MSFERPSTKTPDKSLLPNVHIEGASHPDRETRLHEKIKRRFEDQNHPDLRELSAAERPKTKEEVAIIDFANRASNALIKRYGGQPINITSDQVHVLDKKRVPKDFERLHGAFMNRAFGIVVKERAGKYPLAKTTFHEMLHAKSRISYTGETGETDLVLKRLGLKLESREGKGRYFSWLNEAVTEELTIEFIKVCIELKKWEDEIEETDQFLFQNKSNETPNKDIYFARQEKRGWLGKKKTEVEIEEFSYPKEREALDVLINLTYEKNRTRFSNRQQVFDVFARAMLSGMLLPLGRLIERTFQSIGSKRFRKLGEISTEKDLEALITGGKALLQEIYEIKHPS